MSQHKKQRKYSKVCSKPRYRPTCQHLTENDLLQLLDQEDISELVKIVLSGIKQFQVTLDASDFRSKHLQLVLKLLLEVSSGISSGRDVHMILGEVFNDRCSTFLFQLKIYVEKIQRHTDVSLVCDLFEVLLSKLPETCWSVLPLDELSPTVHCHLNSCNLASGCDMLSKLKCLLEMRDAIKVNINQAHHCILLNHRKAKKIGTTRIIEAFPSCPSGMKLVLPSLHTN